MSVCVNAIVAHDELLGIGLNNAIPWRLSADMAHFKTITMTTSDPDKHNMVVMGRLTWESLPDSFRPLPGRVNVVVSQTLSKEDESQGFLWVSSVDEALSLAAELSDAGTVESVFCIGGGQLYRAFLERDCCERLYVTRIFDRFDCDRVFPDYSTNFDLKEVSERFEGPEFEYDFVQYKRRK